MGADQRRGGGQSPGPAPAPAPAALCWGGSRMVPLPPFFLSPAPFLVCITINGQLRVFLPLVSFLASIPSIFTVMLFSESWFDWHSVVRRSPVASQGNGCATWPRRGAATSSRGCSSLLLPCASSGAATGCPAAGPPSAFRPPEAGAAAVRSLLSPV